ncbi:multicopper oxidase family protein [Planctobacterium marinum]|uniref:multicopper oxidase family protein n=1 Tax=Planctobacterium marinum TaxID=1631968 RepID=UPI001E437AAB|nr:multicopper oxidase domain-containing protein [Planctobacterium marinum]MCC2604990.1 multicopper oxidase domain-containing protein [Planctobacterium marinum]
MKYPFKTNSKLALSALCCLLLAQGYHNPAEARSQVVETSNDCAVMTTAGQRKTLLDNAPKLKNPPVYDFSDKDKDTKAKLVVEYKTPVLAGCQTRLRQWAGPKYDDRPVGPTMVIRPDRTYRADIYNKLPAENEATRQEMTRMGHLHHLDGAGHGGESTTLGYVPPKPVEMNFNVPHNFNVTNLHTHGWHVDPTGKSDNIFREMEPREAPYDQIVHLPKGHPSGTFWYHAHLHGSTTLQVASGMAGALIVNDHNQGLETIEVIRNAPDRIMLFQQLAYGRDGQIENYDNLQQGDISGTGKAVGYKNLNRPVFVNGQAYPKVAIKPGEIQRWRFIHAGITDGINPQLVKVPASDISETGDIDFSNAEVINMYEIALDGLPTGTMPSIPYAVLAPGYRTDVLVQVSASHSDEDSRLFLIDQGQKDKVNVQLRDKTDTDPGVATGAINFRRILLQIETHEALATPQALPTPDQIAQAYTDYTQGDPYTGEAPLKPLTAAELDNGKIQQVHYKVSSQYQCPEHGGSCTPCTDDANNLVSCGAEAKNFYMICDGRDAYGNWSCFNFNPSVDFARILGLNSANIWQISGESNSANHIFHIHVNPFQVQRKFAYGVNYPFPEGMNENDWVWKDTLKAPVFRNTETLTNIASQAQLDEYISGKTFDPKTPTSGVKGIGQGHIATIKTRYTVFTGAFVQHCHVLNHEDQGMMQVVSIEPALEDIKKEIPQLHKAIMEHGRIE